MDFIKKALALGFSNVAIINVHDLVFRLEFRQFCEENICGCYDKVPACPPACGTAEEMRDKAQSYDKALVLQTVLTQPDNSSDIYKKAKFDQNMLTEKLADIIRSSGKDDILIMTAGPYKQHSCISAYGIDAQKMADSAGMICWAQDGDVRFFSQILYRE
ncbi:MAG: DUF2284 domain-containing protein [Lachnospiraceae bacterium]|nr:DUF2284 domain-containing protein [Lachnospiraceae bacterium]